MREGYENFPELARLTNMGLGHDYPFQAVLRLPEDGLLALAFQETLRTGLGTIGYKFQRVCSGHVVCSFVTAEDRAKLVSVRAGEDFDHKVREYHAAMVSPAARP